ncbi:hypothetical protein PPL_04169 [Heterostelium album PN500]|uniref:ABC-2 type transporter transmembrane domain-containing protein n=1 Tax=Heterostelium pallidum (strain ATCC 26659 / Pp 5 / PN500) TaxID=670386 RepID=D3B678_HETP5|nr:hypothetical protein PPL_04169 [Heterostelium album PN500]EFA83376.1 hypothetical protein PPL_04169 [Heterostelium album PN500]|eukprot:XP_020435493.1 hypothetical protein PPL_04169 [Heterostelium album PN500]
MTLSMDITFAVGATVIITNQLFSGFFVRTDSLPKSFGWIHHIDYSFYAFRGLLINEFDYKELPCNPLNPLETVEGRCPTGTEFLINYDITNGNKYHDLGHLSIFTFWDDLSSSSSVETTKQQQLSNHHGDINLLYAVTLYPSFVTK